MAKFHIAMPNDLQQQVERRGPRSTIITRDLERYYWLIDRGRRQLTTLTDAEWTALRAATISTAWEPWSIPHVIDAIADADEIVAYDVDRAALLTKLQQLDIIGRFALVDQLEQQREMTE